MASISLIQLLYQYDTSLKLSLTPFPSDFQESQNFSFKTSDLLKSPGFDSSSKVLDTETGEIVIVYSTFKLICTMFIYSKKATKT